MNKTQLVECVALEANITKKVANETVDAVLAVVSKALAEGDSVKVAGFGNFVVKERKERKGRNPLTKEEITIPATTVISFKASDMPSLTISSCPSASEILFPFFSSIWPLSTEYTRVDKNSCRSSVSPNVSRTSISSSPNIFKP